MAADRGNQKPPGREPTREEEAQAGRIPALSDLARRVIGLGLSGFFLTEETIRKALGDTLPRDWADFAAEQSERTRKEFLERLSFELAQTLEKVNLAEVLRELMEGRTLEVHAEIRLGSGKESRIHAAARDTEEDA